MGAFFVGFPLPVDQSIDVFFCKRSSLPSSFHPGGGRLSSFTKHQWFLDVFWTPGRLIFFKSRWSWWTSDQCESLCYLPLREEILHLLECINPYKKWDKLYINLNCLAGFLNHQQYHIWMLSLNSDSFRAWATVEARCAWWLWCQCSQWCA